MTMFDPPTFDEFNLKYKNNYRMEGYGINGLVIHNPCPFCAEPDAFTNQIFDSLQALEEHHTCEKCLRTFTYETQVSGDSMFFKLILLDGVGPPSYLESITVRQNE